MLKTTLDSFAMWVGYGLMFIGGLSAVLFIISLGINYCWRKLRDAYSFTDLHLAMQDYERKRQRLRSGSAGEKGDE